MHCFFNVTVLFFLNISVPYSRLEKEKNTLVVELDGLSGQLDGALKAKDSFQSRMEAAEAGNMRLKSQVDEMNVQIQSLTSFKVKITQENFDLQHSVQELDSSNAALAKAKSQLQAQNDDLKRNLDDETRVSDTWWFVVLFSKSNECLNF